MMRYRTPEEEELFKKLDDKNLSEDERNIIIEKLQEIDQKEKFPFC